MVRGPKMLARFAASPPGTGLGLTPALRRISVAGTSASSLREDGAAGGGETSPTAAALPLALLDDIFDGSARDAEVKGLRCL